MLSENELVGLLLCLPQEVEMVDIPPCVGHLGGRGRGRERELEMQAHTDPWYSMDMIMVG